MKEEQEKILKEFDEKFLCEMCEDCGSFKRGNTTNDVMKSFIQQSNERVLEAYKKELAEKAEGMRIKDGGIIKLNYANGKEYEIEAESDREIFYNQAITDILSLITETEK